MKRILALTLCLVMLMLTACDDLTPYEKLEQKTLSYGTGASALATERDTEGHNLIYIEMCIERYGRVVFLLDATAAPKTVVNFCSLIKGGFYNEPEKGDDRYHGNTFHIVDPGRLLQGGCPKANGTGTLSEKVEGEFSDNGYYGNDISHKKGVISMVREGTESDPGYDTAACQFFICMKDMPELDGQYAAFGYVIQGMSVLEELMRDYSTAGNPELKYIIEEKSNQPTIRFMKGYNSSDNYLWSDKHN